MVRVDRLGGDRRTAGRLRNRHHPVEQPVDDPIRQEVVARLELRDRPPGADQADPRDEDFEPARQHLHFPTVGVHDAHSLPPQEAGERQHRRHVTGINGPRFEP
jgi:hypothetical protein